MTFSMDAFAAAIDLAAVLLLALGIKGLSKVSSARGANGLAALAMGLAVVGLLIEIRPDPIAWLWIAAGSQWRASRCSVSPAAVTSSTWITPRAPEPSVPTSGAQSSSSGVKCCPSR